MDDRGWRTYLEKYHSNRPGITEDLLRDCRGQVRAGGRPVNPYEWLVEGLPDATRKSGSWLDVGCGSAPLRPLLPDGQYVGIDLSAAELSSARVSRRGPVLVADAAFLPFGVGCIDQVTASMSMMLLARRQTLREVARVSRPGARLAMTIPTSWPLHWRDAPLLMALVAALRTLPKYPRGKRSGLARLVAHAGFRVDSDRTLRFSYPLDSDERAGRLVDSLYLPKAPAARIRAAQAALARRAGPGVTFPVPIRRIVATLLEP